LPNIVSIHPFSWITFHYRISEKSASFRYIVIYRNYNDISVFVKGKTNQFEQSSRNEYE